MANITAGMVKELREMTGAGMMDCKKALAATDGNMDDAVKFLREKGLAAAQKKAGRIAAEGIVKAEVKNGVAAIVEVNSETDFVAKNEKFQAYVGQVLDQITTTSAADIDAFMKEAWCEDASLTVEQALSEQVAVIGEKLSIRRFEKIALAENGIADAYIHGGGRIGVLVYAESDVKSDEIAAALHQVSLQIASMKPVYVSRDEMSDEFIAAEKETLLAAAKNEKPDAPEKVLEGIVMGRLNKELKEFCLLDQIYVFAEDGKQTIGQFIDSVGKKAGGKVTIKKFVRFETGEGIEKKQEDFAAEVAKQIGQ